VAGYRTSETVQAITPHKNIGNSVSKNLNSPDPTFLEGQGRFHTVFFNHMQ